ncbi:hypothetical protein TNCV_4617031 [Trichonephila clavipes]|nr:hypothetical protein TNCV_4617031 [Trichonephila clavipes]
MAALDQWSSKCVPWNPEISRGPLPGHSCFGSISAKTTLSWRASSHHGVQQGRQCAGHLAQTRHGTYQEYTQNIVLQHQGEDPTGKPASPYLQH